MQRPLIDSEYIFGIHEPGGEHLMLAAGRPGWVLFTEAIGHDSADRTGIDFTTFSSQGLGVICRLNHGYEPDGTLPHSSQYEDFARRVANFVAVSRGCKIWMIGNEMNYAVERPGIQIDWSRHASSRTGAPEMADPMRRGLAVRFNILPDYSTEIRTTRAAIVSQGETITPALYARCYRLCREAIHRLPGHEDDQVLVGAVAPWNTQTIYTNNPNADWVQYFQDILAELGPKGCDGFTLHAFTHGADPALISDETKLGPPFQNHHRHFRVYQDFLAAVPPTMRHLPAYITQTDQVQPWQDLNTGWVQDAYAEINHWNQQPGNQQIRALFLYRWPRMDKWFIDGKTGVMEDFWLALQNDYRWRGSDVEFEFQAEEPPPAFAPQPPRRAEPGKPPYQVEWRDDRFPPKMMVGETITVSIILQNTGSLTWSWGGGNPFRLGYHYYRNRRRLALPPQFDVRTDIPEDVLPGETVTIQARVALPAEAGNYTIEFDMVQEGITWFKEQQSPVLTRWITVEAPAPPLETNETGTVQNMLVPLFKDISAQLPRSNVAYARRSMNQVRYLVISHTGANPRLSLERIAQTHIQHGYPGIVYDFVVNTSGQIFRVSELEDVAQPNQVWSEQGVNICLTGNFSATPPPVAQLEAAGRLCAWLAQNLGLDPETIVGLGELTKGDSPGATFYAGPTWKNMIIRQVQLHLAVLNNSNAVDDGRHEELEALLQEAQGQNSDLKTQLQRLSEERDRLRTAQQTLQTELADLRREQETAPVETELRVHNIVDQLPRDADRYIPRRAQDVRYLVINHTGVAPSVAWQNIAKAHRPDWPGILYDFGIDEKGRVYQMQPFEEVVETGQEYLANAINIAFAGEFNRQIPTDEQIYAGGRLIAWLMQRFAQVKMDNIKGISEFIQHTSPGEQWLNGTRWKDLLLASVRRASGMIEPSVAEAELRGKIADLEQRLESAQQAAAVLEHQKKRVETENHRLQTELASKQQGANAFVIPPPAMRNITDQLPKHPTLRYDRRSLSQITHIAVHHTAAPPSLGPLRIAELHVNADPGRGKEPWPGIGYHFFVHADGAIEQTNRLETASYHVFRHNNYTIGVAFAGSFMNGKIPTSAQLRAGAHLIAWLMQDLHIPLARVWGHREFPENTTVCPGNEWTLGNRWRDLLFERIEQVQNGVGIKSLRHYMLFWQRADGERPFARQDLINALAYIARFRPAIGFSVEDAKYAEYVTIVGNEAGVSATDEQILLSHGCKVERIAGRDENETSHILTEMAELGRRFREFDVEF
ncbi:MAG: N-acetylmuramoyl-L-alanine amidase [Caldilineaceae bacterium]